MHADTAATTSSTVCAGSSTGDPGSDTVTDPCSSKRASSRGQVDPAAGVGELRRPQGVLGPDQRAQSGLLLPRQPAELGGLSPELAAAALDERQHLEHAIVHGASQTGTLRLGGRHAFGRGDAPLPSAAATRRRSR